MSYCKKIHREAVSRYNNLAIKNAYCTRLKWVLFAESELCGRIQ